MKLYLHAFSPSDMSRPLILITTVHSSLTNSYTDPYYPVNPFVN